MKIIKILFVIALLPVFSYGQYGRLGANQGEFGGGFGMTWIDDQPHYSFHIFPEVSFSKIGIGLDLNLEFDPDGNIRSENFNEFSDYISIIRYVRYGIKGDPVYVRLGALDHATLGHGSLIYLYNNSPGFDTRKTGLEFDVDFSTFGFETIYSSFGEAGLVGLRGYVRPLQFTSLKSIPIIKNLEIGASFVGDYHEFAYVKQTIADPAAFNKYNYEKENSLTAYGFDIGLPILRNRLVNLDLYLDYAKINDFGDGTAAGLNMNFHGLGLVTVNAKFERRFNNDQYLPAYFNSLYELERFSLDETSGSFSSKLKTLENAYSIGNGFYGELLVELLGTFDIIGSYQRLDEHPTSGILHLSTDITPPEMSFVARAGYDKTNIKDESDLFKLDDRSYMYAELGYKPMPYLLVSMVYNWTFTPLRDADDKVIDYVPQKKIEPRISFIYPFSVGGN